MRKLLILSLGLLFFVNAHKAEASFVIDPTSAPSCEDISYEFLDTDNAFYIYNLDTGMKVYSGSGYIRWSGDPTGYLCDGQGFGNGDGAFLTEGDMPDGIYAVVRNTGSGACRDTDEYSACHDSEHYISEMDFTIGEPDCGMACLIGTAEAGFEEEVGFSYASAVGWTSDSLIKTFIGGGVATLVGLSRWLIAVVIVGVILHFCFSAFIHFRNYR